MIVTNGYVSPLFDCLFEIKETGNYSRLVLSISDLDLRCIPINSKIYILFTSFIPSLLLYGEDNKVDLFCKCVVYFVKNSSNLEDLMESNLLIKFLLIKEDSVIRSLVKIIEYSLERSLKELLQYYLVGGLRSKLLEYLRSHNNPDIDSLFFTVQQSLHQLIYAYPELVYQDPLDDQDLTLIG